MMEGLPIIAYRPIPRYIKLESLDEPQEENSVVEEKWMLQVKVFKNACSMFINFEITTL